MNDRIQHRLSLPSRQVLPICPDVIPPRIERCLTKSERAVFDEWESAFTNVRRNFTRFRDGIYWDSEIEFTSHVSQMLLADANLHNVPEQSREHYAGLVVLSRLLPRLASPMQAITEVLHQLVGELSAHLDESGDSQRIEPLGENVSPIPVQLKESATEPNDSAQTEDVGVYIADICRDLGITPKALGEWANGQKWRRAKRGEREFKYSRTEYIKILEYAKESPKQRIRDNAKSLLEKLGETEVKPN